MSASCNFVAGGGVLSDFSWSLDKGGGVAGELLVFNVEEDEHPDDVNSLVGSSGGSMATLLSLFLEKKTRHQIFCQRSDNHQ